MTGIEIFKLLPKKNCKECGQATCLAFAMALAAAKTSLDKCPYASDECKETLGGAAAPPIKLVKIGAGAKERELGDETIIFRHDKSFVHPTSYAIEIDDKDVNDAVIEKINDLVFERVGQTISVDGFALKNASGDAATFAKAAEAIAQKGKFALVLMSDDSAAIDAALAVTAKEKPLIYAASEQNWGAMAELATKHGVPLAVRGHDLQSTSDIVEQIVKQNKDIDLVIDTGAQGLSQQISEMTQTRRLAIKKKYRPFGFPLMAVANGEDAEYNVVLATGYTAKYASLVILKACEKSQILPLLAWRMNLYTDPQKPSQVEPGLHAIGDATPDSPVFVTTNFSLTFYSVEGELSSAKIPLWMIAAPTDGTSVLTAYAAGKFTADNVAAFMKEIDLESKVNTRKIVIPGYVAVMKGGLEEKSGWSVMVAPSEASGLRAFTKANFS